MKKIVLLLLIQSLFVGIPLFGMEKDAEQWLILGAGTVHDISKWNEYFEGIKEKEGRTIEWVGLDYSCPESPQCIHANFNDLKQLNKALKEYNDYFDVILFDISVSHFAKWTPAFLQVFKRKLKKGGKFYIDLSLNLKGKQGSIKFADPTTGITLLKKYFGPNVRYYEDRRYPSYHSIYKERPSKEKYYLIVKGSITIDMPEEIEEIEEKEPFPYKPVGIFDLKSGLAYQNISIIDENDNLYVLKNMGNLTLDKFQEVIKELVKREDIKIWNPIDEKWLDEEDQDLTLNELHVDNGDFFSINREIKVKPGEKSLVKQYPEIYENLKRKSARRLRKILRGK